ncbi:hypothetical protein [Kribbella sp.]|uniref:hypothetical protein n=1 Tax=Kribbella sp. TaxID=1871183 RepID=UPI002D31EAF6|nr:hypothetical protein [Kribbella sp.]HZX03628.1 hypothetical protein [Kribbella sp.]
MSDIDMYWLTDPNAPFATFLNVVQAHYHPEIRNDNFGLLVQWAREAGPDDVKMATFKKELTQLLEGDRAGLRAGAIDVAAAYDDWDTDDEFLAWLWHELYPSEPLPMPESGRPE